MRDLHLAHLARRTAFTLGATALALFGNAEAASFSDINLGTAGPGALNLGVFVTGPTPLNASNSATLFQPNLGLSNGSSTNFSGFSTLAGNLYKDPGATLQANFASQFIVSGSTITQSLAQAVTDVRTAASLAASLTPDFSLGNLGGSATTINATGTSNGFGGKNTVVRIGAINISNHSHDVTINGGANDWFVLNIASISVSNGGILLAGGLTPNHVLLNVTGAGNAVNVSNSTSVLNGTILAPNSKISLSPGTINGAIIGYQIQTSSGPIVNGSPYVYAPVPVPPAAFLFPSALGLLAWVRRKQAAV